MVNLRGCILGQACKRLGAWCLQGHSGLCAEYAHREDQPPEGIYVAAISMSTALLFAVLCTAAPHRCVRLGSHLKERGSGPSHSTGENREIDLGKLCECIYAYMHTT